MIDPGHRLGLVAQAKIRERLADPDQLDRHRAVEVRVVRPIHPTHAALTDELGIFIARVVEPLCRLTRDLRPQTLTHLLRHHVDPTALLRSEALDEVRGVVVLVHAWV